MTKTIDFIPAANQRRDLNNDLCALVKIQVVDDVTDVEGNVLGDISVHGVEKWVYMAKGSKNMKIHFKNNLPLKVKFQDYQILALESNRVYELAISTPATANIAKGGSLQMKGIPTSAVVYIWSDKMSKQPFRPNSDGTLSTVLPLGLYQYQVLADGYQEAQNSIYLTGESRQITVNLVPIMGVISLNCPTTQVDYYLNGQLIQRDRSTTQWVGQVKPGQYIVEAKRNGYISQSVTVDVLADKTKVITFDRLVSEAEIREQNERREKEREHQEQMERLQQVEIARAKAEAESMVKMRADSIAREQEVLKIKETRIKAEQEEAMAKARKAERQQIQQRLEEKDSHGVSFALTAGVNIATTQFSSNYKGSTKSLTGFHLGVKAEYLLSTNWGLSAGVLYSGKGYRYTQTETDIDEKATAPFIDIPVQASLRLPLSSEFKLLLNAGPYMAFCMGGSIKDEWSKQHSNTNNAYDESFSSTYGSFDYGLQVGIGFNIHYHYQVYANYQLGFASRYKNRNLMIGLGYRF